MTPRSRPCLPRRGRSTLHLRNLMEASEQLRSTRDELAFAEVEAEKANACVLRSEEKIVSKPSEKAKMRLKDALAVAKARKKVIKRLTKEVTKAENKELELRQRLHACQVVIVTDEEEFDFSVLEGLKNEVRVSNLVDEETRMLMIARGKDHGFNVK